MSVAENLRSIDDTNHATLAVALNGTVVPDGGLGLDGDGKDLIADLVLDVKITAEEARAVEGLARLVEAALGDRVCALVEVELDRVSHGGLEVGRREGETSVADLDLVDFGESGRDEREEEGRGVHCD